MLLFGLVTTGQQMHNFLHLHISLMAPPAFDVLREILHYCCFALRIAAPSSILGPLHTDTSHFISSVHQDCPLKVRYLHFLHNLSIQRLVVAPHHLHGVVHILIPLMVVDRV